MGVTTCLLDREKASGAQKGYHGESGLRPGGSLRDPPQPALIACFPRPSPQRTRRRPNPAKATWKIIN